MITFNVDDSIDIGPFDIAIPSPTSSVCAAGSKPDLLRISDCFHADDSSCVDDFVVSPSSKSDATAMPSCGGIFAHRRLVSDSPFRPTSGGFGALDSSNAPYSGGIFPQCPQL